MANTFKKLVAAVAAVSVTTAAFAVDSGNTSMGVSATINEECALGGATALTFGALSMLGTGVATTSASLSTGGGSFQAICTNGTTSPKLRFTSANGGTAGFALIGADSTTKIPYSLAESGGTAIAHDTAVSFTGLTADGTTKNLAVKGTIAASDKAQKKAQAYSDTITITSSYGL